MCLKEIISLIKDVLIIMGVLFGVYLSIKLYLQFAPKIIYKITPSWSDTSKDIVVLKIEIENKSKVKLSTNRLRFQINRHEKLSVTELKEWVEFDEKAEEIKTKGLFYPGSILRSVFIA